MVDWYGVRQLFPGVWCINERMVNLYVIAGAERAMVIDTGFGVGDLARTVRTLTELPLTVVMTHGHMDHITGATQFGQALIHPGDMAMIPENSTEARRGIVERFFKDSGIPDGFDVEAWVHAPAAEFFPLAEDAVFDLGGRTVQVIATPGHTAGSACLLDDTGLLFTGDTIVDMPILMCLPQSLTLRVYADSLAKLLGYKDCITALLPGHGAEPFTLARLEELHAGAEAILSGEVVGKPEQVFQRQATCARFANSAICYDPERLN